MAEADDAAVPLAGIEEMQLDETLRDDSLDVSVLQLSEKESQILELYDQLEQLVMEIGLLQAQDAQAAISNGEVFVII